MTVHRWTDATTGKVYDFTTEECLTVMGLCVERLTEHVKRFHSRKIQQTVEVGTPLSAFIRPNPRYQENATMSLEQKIEELTHAVKALTEAFVATGTKEVRPVTKAAEVASPAPAPKPTKKAEPAPAPAEPEITIEELKTLAGKVKDKFDVATAKGLIKKYGKAEKTDQVEPAHFKALKDALEAKLNSDDEEGDDDGV